MPALNASITSLAKNRASLAGILLACSVLACSLGSSPSVPSIVPPTAEPTVPQSVIEVPTLLPVATIQNNTIPTLASGNPVDIGTTPLPVCPPLAPRLFVGGSARVTPGEPNALRSQPTRNNSLSAILGQIPGGATFLVVSGPQCAEGFYWWQVNYNGQIGWTPEGENSTYWLEPLTTATPDCPGVPPAILLVGIQAVVMPGDPNLLRASPAKIGTNVIGQIPAGGVFDVIGGPQCADGLRFWQVTYKGLTGWTADGQGSAYWLMPQH
jgi:hypothetical protein